MQLCSEKFPLALGSAYVSSAQYSEYKTEMSQPELYISNPDSPGMCPWSRHTQ